MVPTVRRECPMTDELDRVQVQRLFTDHDLGFADALEVLRSHFRQASSWNDRAVSYSHERQDALVLTFNWKREFMGFDVGPGLRGDDQSRLGELFAAPRPRRVMGTVIFATVPTSTGGVTAAAAAASHRQRAR